MGGIYLRSPDFDKGFPITAEQLHYLVKQGHVDFPDMSEMHITERNAVDTLSKYVLHQAFCLRLATPGSIMTN